MWKSVWKGVGRRENGGCGLMNDLLFAAGIEPPPPPPPPASGIYLLYDRVGFE
jgi:hypothetical protein